LRKNRDHTLSENLPVIAMIFCVPVGMLVSEIGGGMTAGVLFMGNQDMATTASYFTSSLFALAVLAGFKWWYRPKYEGSVRMHISMKDILPEYLFGMGYVLLSAILLLCIHHFCFKPSLDALGMSLSAGFVEETAFRAMPIAIAMRYFRDSGDKTLKAAVITSLIFGLAHAFNILAGATPVLAVVQVICTFCHGLFMCMLYQRTGSILPSIFLHVVNDFVFLTMDPTLTEGVMTGQLTWYNILDTVLMIAHAVYAVYVLRRNHQPPIQEIWDRKWNREEEAKEEESVG